MFFVCVVLLKVGWFNLAVTASMEGGILFFFFGSSVSLQISVTIYDVPTYFFSFDNTILLRIYFSFFVRIIKICDFFCLQFSEEIVSSDDFFRSKKLKRMFQKKRK